MYVFTKMWEYKEKNQKNVSKKEHNLVQDKKSRDRVYGWRENKEYIRKRTRKRRRERET